MKRLAHRLLLIALFVPLHATSIAATVQLAFTNMHQQPDQCEFSQFSRRYQSPIWGIWEYLGLFGIVLDAGAEDLRDDGSAWEVTTPPEAFEKVREALLTAGVTPATAEIAFVPQNYVKLSGAQAQQMMRMVETLEDHDDVQHVYANFDIDEKEMQAAVAS